MKAAPTLNNLRFAPCTSGLRLLITLVAAARHAMAGGVFVLPAGLKFCEAFGLSPMNKMNLTRRGICRGKISLRKNQPTSKKGRNQRQINE
ncbi:MAG: hypothetical protein ABSH11_12010 [Verrucomicrobiota bacterium]|jgi:hypothetical protein